MLFKFSPGLIIVALGFDMYFADPIGNCYLTSQSYYNFAQKIAQLSRSCSNGKIAFVLEGGYSVTGLPICVKALIQGLLDESHHSEPFENLTFPEFKRSQDLESIMSMLRKILEPYWGNL
jgi:acetoin utilization deacetylase AcuC-like enzyme